MLNKKLHEEVQEFDEAREAEQIAELADIVEVIYAVVESKAKPEEFEEVRLSKKEECGGFLKICS